MDQSYLLVIIAMILKTSSPMEDEEISVWVITGGRADLPCEPRPKLPDDQPQLVLWYRSSYTLPIYSYDVRVGEFTSGVRWADESAFGGRAYFSSLTEPPGLVLDPVHQYDEGLYTCRVDYRVSPSTTTLVNLTVVIPPGPPLIIWGGRAVVGVIGPLREDERTELTCRSVGGRPLPKVTWWHYGRRMPLLTVNTTADPITGTYAVEARLSITARRDLQGAHLTCHTQTPIDENAHKAILDQPRTVFVMLNITLSPVEVRILSPDEVVTQIGSTISLVCRAIGSHPPAELTWWRGRSPLTPHTTYAIEDSGNITTATLTLTVSRADDGTRLSCSGINPALPQQPQTDTAKIVVHYSPVVDLSLGRALNPRTIKEGDNVYFECNVEANPRFHRVDWFHNGVELVHNMSAGVVMSGLSLVLRELDRKYSGTYICTASNMEGRTTSNAVHLTVKHKPVCAGTGQTRTQGAARGAATSLKCTVEAEPSSDITWKWTRIALNMGEEEEENSINRSKKKEEDEEEEEEEVSGEFMTSNGLTSVIQFTPQDPEDYGIFRCYATNSVGRQKVACAVHLVPAGPPDAPSNCSALPLESEVEIEVDVASLAITCMEGFDGGLPQHFQLQAWQDGVVVANLTSQFPEWVLGGVRSGTGVRLNIAALNARGKSEPLAMEVQTTNAQQRAAPGVELPLDLPILMGAVAGIVGVILLFLIVCLLLARRVRTKPQKPSEEIAMTPTVADSFDPDVVQSIYRRPPSLDVLPCVNEEEDSEQEENQSMSSSKKEISAFVHSCSDSFVAKGQTQTQGENRDESLQGRSSECTSCSNPRQFRQDPGSGSGGAAWQRQQDPSNPQCPSDDSGVSESESDSELRELVTEKKVAATLFQKEDGRTYIAVPSGQPHISGSSSRELQKLDVNSSPSSSSTSRPRDSTSSARKDARSRGDTFPEEVGLLPSTQRENQLVQISGEIGRIPVSVQDLRAAKTICLAMSPETPAVMQSSGKHKGKISKRPSKGMKETFHPVTARDIHFVPKSHDCTRGIPDQTEKSERGRSADVPSLKDRKSSQTKRTKGKTVPTDQLSSPAATSPSPELDSESFRLAHMLSKESSV